MSDKYYIANFVPTYDSFYEAPIHQSKMNIQEDLVEDYFITDNSIPHRIKEYIESTIHIIVDIPYGITKSALHKVFHK